MSNDLISREALKEAIKTYDKFACLPNCKLEPVRNLEHPEMFVPYIHFDDVIKAIDNAPTVPQVTVFAENTSKEEIEDFKQELEKVLERPQGEWILPNFYGDGVSYECNKCHIPHEGYIGKDDKPHGYDFCPNCGADMRDEKEAKRYEDNSNN